TGRRRNSSKSSIFLRGSRRRRRRFAELQESGSRRQNNAAAGGLRYNLALLMDFDQLVTFLYVAKLGSFSRAGEKVFRSQSAVSSQIRLLEQEYGDKLFDRSGKSVRLTPAGRVLF